MRAAPAARALPQIETERLVLRPYLAQDFEAYRDMWADPAVLTHFKVKPSRDEAWSRMLRVAGMWPVLGYGLFVAVDKESGRFAGETGFADFNRVIDPPQGSDPEGAWVFAAWTHGKGLAYEASLAAQAWMDRTHGFRRTWCMIAPENTPSLRLAARLGYQQQGHVTLGGETQVLLQRFTP